MKQVQYASDVPQLPGRLPARKASATATGKHTAKYQKTSYGQYGLVSVFMIIYVYNMTYYILYIYIVEALIHHGWHCDLFLPVAIAAQFISIDLKPFATHPRQNQCSFALCHLRRCS